MYLKLYLIQNYNNADIDQPTPSFSLLFGSFHCYLVQKSISSGPDHVSASHLCIDKLFGRYNALQLSFNWEGDLRNPSYCLNKIKEFEFKTEILLNFNVW